MILIQANTNIYFIIGGFTLLVLMFTLWLLLKKKPKEVIPLLDIDLLLEGLGGAKNIQALSSEHQRLKLILNDLKLIKQDILKSMEIPAFLKGKELTLLIKHHTKDVLSNLSERRKEVN